MNTVDSCYKNNNAVIFYITANGRETARRIESFLPGARIIKFNVAEVRKSWGSADSLVFIMATGIVVRTIASLLSDKLSDPAVVVLDEKGEFSISLAGGHIAGANSLARDIAEFIGAKPVITTASDVNNLPSIDLWARDNNLAIENREAVPGIAARLIDEGKLNVYLDAYIETNATGNEKGDSGLVLPDEFVRVDGNREADIIISSISSRTNVEVSDRNDRRQLYLRPKTIIAGIGCNKGTSKAEIEEAVDEVLDKAGISRLSLCAVATIDIKANEPGLRAFAEQRSLDMRTFTAEELNSVEWTTKSETVFRATGAYGVAEPSAILAAQTSGIVSGSDMVKISDRQSATLITAKQKLGNVTVALAAIDTINAINPANAMNAIRKAGAIYVVGTGPGNIDHITPYAQKIIADSEVIVGYHTYLRLITELTEGKVIVSTGMTREIDRCVKAVDLALKGKRVCVVSGGDPGIYAMAGLVFEIIKERGCGDSIKIEVVPGISALNACASRLGAPLMHDFASISLSDRLTPWELIEKRLNAAASAGMVIILYNPRSKGRPDRIDRARELMLEYRPATTPVGIVKSAMRADETIVLTDLGRMLYNEIDMQTTVIIGNTATYIWNGRMITPRGYKVREDNE